MKTTKLIVLMAAMVAFSISCTNNNRSGSNTSGEETVQTNNVNAEMEDQRTLSDVDTVTSPGSNSVDLKDQGSSNSPANNGQGKSTVDNSNTSPSVTPGSGQDANMAGQSSTHGKKTTAGDK